LSGTVEDGSDLSPFVSWHQLMNRQQNKHGLDGKEWFQRLTYVHLNVSSCGNTFGHILYVKQQKNIEMCVDHYALSFDILYVIL
jgi:hypothetical protein